MGECVLPKKVIWADENFCIDWATFELSQIAKDAKNAGEETFLVCNNLGEQRTMEFQQAAVNGAGTTSQCTDEIQLVDGGQRKEWNGPIP